MPEMIDLLTDEPNESHELGQLRAVLLRRDRELVVEQQTEIDSLRQRIAELETLISETANRAQAVEEVLVEAVRCSERPTGELGLALKPEIDQAIYSSARDDGTLLAEALYPVIGPAIRKMVASMFTLDKDKSGRSFRVEQILLIERSTGLMLASTATHADALEDADVVSGMIDALTSFVQDAFEAPEEDGLSDLRVGDLSVLVETGPKAVLASVVRGIPSQDFKDAAALTLESFHRTYGAELAHFDGTIDVFDGAADLLGDLHSGAGSHAQASEGSPWAILAVAIVLIVTIVLVALAVAS